MNCNFFVKWLGNKLQRAHCLPLIITGFVAATTGVNMAHKRTIWKLFTFLFNFGVFIIRSVIEQTEWWQQLLACLPRPLYDNPTSSLQRLRRRLVCVLTKPHVDILMISCKCCSVRGENRSKWKWEVCVWLEWPKWLTSFQSMQSFVECYWLFLLCSIVWVTIIYVS